MGFVPPGVGAGAWRLVGGPDVNVVVSVVTCNHFTFMTEFIFIGLYIFLTHGKLV